MISGVHLIVYSAEVEAMRRFFGEVLELDSVDAGGGWPIFALPPAELAVHPAGDGGERHQLFLICDDLDATLARLAARGVEPAGPVTEQSWGRLAPIRVPGAGEIAIYQPRHLRPNAG